MTKPWLLDGFKTGQKPVRLQVRGEWSLTGRQRAELDQRFQAWMAGVRLSLASTHRTTGRLADGSTYTFFTTATGTDIIVAPKEGRPEERPKYQAWTAKFDPSFLAPLYEREEIELKVQPTGYLESTITGTAIVPDWRGDVQNDQIEVATSYQHTLVFQAGPLSAEVRLEGTWTASNIVVPTQDILLFDLEISDFFAGTLGMPDTLGEVDPSTRMTTRYPVIGFNPTQINSQTVGVIFGKPDVEDWDGPERFLSWFNTTSRPAAYPFFNPMVYTASFTGIAGLGTALADYELSRIAYERGAAIGDQIRQSILREQSRIVDIDAQVQLKRKADRPGILSAAEAMAMAGIGGNPHATACLLDPPYKTGFEPNALMDHLTGGSSTYYGPELYGGESEELNARGQHTLVALGRNALAATPGDEAGSIASYKPRQKFALPVGTFGAVASGIVHFTSRYLYFHGDEPAQAGAASVELTVPAAHADAQLQGLKRSEQGHEIVFDFQLGEKTELTTVYFEYHAWDRYTGEWRWTVLPQALALDAVWITFESPDYLLANTGGFYPEITTYEPPSGRYVDGVRIRSVTKQVRQANGTWSAPVPVTKFTPWQVSFNANVLKGLVNAVVVATKVPSTGRPKPGAASPAGFVWDQGTPSAKSLLKLSGTVPESWITAQALRALGIV